MTKLYNTLWVEKYRPTELKNLIGNQHLKSSLTGYMNSDDMPHLLLTGSPGTGKTTISKLLVNGINCDYMMLNASDENNIDTVRSKIRGFASTTSFKPLKIIVLDEFDGFTRQAQDALRNMMEQFSVTTRFILTANYIERISDAIISRTQHFEVHPPSKKEVAVRIGEILLDEGIVFEWEDVKTLLDSYYPDIRKIINECNLYSHDGILKIERGLVIDSDFKTQLIDILKQKGKSLNSKITEARQLLLNAKLRDYSAVYRLLFDKVTEFDDNKVAELILIINKGQYQDSLVVDKEINLCATLVEILQTL